MMCKRCRGQSHNMSNPASNNPTVLASASFGEQNTPAVSHLQQKQTGL